MQALKICSLTMLTLSVLAGCVNSQANQYSSQQEEITSQEVETAEEMADSVETIEESSATTEGTAVTHRVWTDYQHYATPNESGYAYTIYDDPDISSEIFPMDERSSENVLLFTFDDGPAEPDSYMLEMAKLMKSKNVNAIFLVNGMFLEGERGRSILKEVYDMGFEIGNHTTYHQNLKELTYEEQYEEIARTSELIEEITGEPARWFRPPFGLYNLDTLKICNELGMQLFTWNFGYDWQDVYLDGDALAEISLTTDYLRKGANILMHDRKWTYEALERMIDGYREMGYEIVDPLLIQSRPNNLEVGTNSQQE